MSRRGGTNRKATKRPVVVLAGEGDNDREVLRIVLEALNSELRGRLVQIKDPVRLKTATSGNLRDRIRNIVLKAKGKAELSGSILAGLIVHEDLDAVVGPEYERTRRRIKEELRRQLPDGTCLALAAWEAEAWMLLFPKALEAFRTGWRVPPHTHRQGHRQVSRPQADPGGRAGAAQVPRVRRTWSLPQGGRSWPALRPNRHQPLVHGLPR